MRHDAGDTHRRSIAHLRQVRAAGDLGRLVARRLGKQRDGIKTKSLCQRFDDIDAGRVVSGFQLANVGLGHSSLAAERLLAPIALQSFPPNIGSEDVSELWAAVPWHARKARFRPLDCLLSMFNNRDAGAPCNSGFAHVASGQSGRGMR